MNRPLPSAVTPRIQKKSGDFGAKLSQKMVKSDYGATGRRTELKRTQGEPESVARNFPTNSSRVSWGGITQRAWTILRRQRQTAQFQPEHGTMFCSRPGFINSAAPNPGKRARLGSRSNRNGPGSARSAHLCTRARPVMRLSTSRVSGFAGQNMPEFHASFRFLSPSGLTTKVIIIRQNMPELSSSPTYGGEFLTP